MVGRRFFGWLGPPGLLGRLSKRNRSHAKDCRHRIPTGVVMKVAKGWSLGEFSPYLGIKKASKTGISVSSSHSQLILVSCRSAGFHVFVPVCGVWRPKDVGSWKLILGWNYIIVFFVRDLNFGCEKDKIWLVDMHIFTYIYILYDIYIYIYDIYIHDICTVIL